MIYCYTHQVGLPADVRWLTDKLVSIAASYKTELKEPISCEALAERLSNTLHIWTTKEDIRALCIQVVLASHDKIISVYTFTIISVYIRSIVERLTYLFRSTRVEECTQTYYGFVLVFTV